MSPNLSLCPWVRVSSLALLAALLWGVVGPQPVPAADLDKLDSAIKEIPADAAFFSSMMRNREQIEAIAKSKAWAKLMALPVLKQGLEAVNAPGGPGDQFQQWYKIAENKQLIDFLLDLVSNEVFVYGGAAWPGSGSLVGELYNSVTLENAAMQLAGGAPFNEQERMAHAFLRAIQKKLDRVEVPELIVGFKVTDAARAQGQLKKLEQLLQEQIKQVPELKGRLKKASIAGGEFLTLDLDGKMVPWETIPPFSIVEKPEQYKDVLKKLQTMKLSINLGLRGKYVLLAVGTSSDMLTKLGKGKRLIDLPELKPLEKYADQRLVSISYSSQSMNAALVGNVGIFDNYIDLAEKFLPKANLKPEQQAKIKKDLAELSKEMKAVVPKAGASLDFSYMTAKGYEGYTHNYGELPYLDGSKPLSILDHVGGSPLGFFVNRSKAQPDAWPQAVKWLKKIYGYVEEYALPQIPAEERQQFTKFMKAATPLLQRFDDATGKLLLPALADGQAGFVLDAKLTSRQWHAAMPNSPRPLPMLEPALVIGVSDAAKLEKAFAEYRVIVNGLMAEVRKISQDFPDFQIPPPEARKLKTGTAYIYPLPEALGLDKKIAPGAAVSDKMAVLTISQEHSERLLSAGPLKITSGPLANTKKPLASAAYFDWAGFVDAIGAWVEFGVGTALAASAEQPVVAVARAQPDDPIRQVRTVIEVLKCLRSYSSATFNEKGVWITHRETLIRDLD